VTRQHTRGFRAAQASLAGASTRRRDKPPPPIPTPAERLAAIRDAAERKRRKTKPQRKD
jgi:hypothetical protein